VIDLELPVIETDESSILLHDLAGKKQNDIPIDNVDFGGNSAKANGWLETLQRFWKQNRIAKI
jgi:hypothetical protein